MASETESKSRQLNLSIYSNSQCLDPIGSNTYYASNLIDGNLSTCWSVNLDSYGYADSPVWGPNIEIEPVKYIDYIVLYNGYGKDNKAYYNNTRASWIQIYRPVAPDTGYPEDTEILYEGPLTDTMEPQKLKINPNFDFTDPVTHIVLKFSDKESGKYYYGTKYNDLSISEIEIWGHD